MTRFGIYRYATSYGFIAMWRGWGFSVDFVLPQYWLYSETRAKHISENPRWSKMMGHRKWFYGAPMRFYLEKPE